MSTTDTQREIQQEGHGSMEADEKERKEVEQERWVVCTSVSHLKWPNMSKIKKNN